jgi:hypothetical protein
MHHPVPLSQHFDSGRFPGISGTDDEINIPEIMLENVVLDRH